MTGLEQFEQAARIHAEACGLTAAEVAEASGALLDTAAVRAVEGAAGSLLLLGDPGTGKTVAAVRWLLRPLYDLRGWYGSESAGWTRRRSKVTCLFRTAKSLSRVQQYDEAAVAPLFTVERLVVDDLGQEYLDKSGFLVSLIDEIVSERHRRRLPTALTTNLTAVEFKARYGGRVVDRIAATGNVVACAGSSLRRGTTGERPIPPLVTAEMLVERMTELAADSARRDAAARARLDAQEREWIASLPPAQASKYVEIKSPAKVAMTDAEVEAKKAQIARDLAAWSARNATPAAEPTT